MTLRKNVGSQKVPFLLVSSTDGTVVTGATVTVKMTLDGAAQASVAGSVAELAGGQYVFSPAQADTNANSIGYLMTATGAVPQHFTIYTTAADPTDSVRLGLTALANAAAGASGGLLISGSNAGTTTLAALTITGATTHTGNVVLSDGLTISAPSTANRAGITVTGNGTGAGLSVTGGNGATGNGIDAIAASTNGSGFSIVATGTGNGLKVASISGDAISAIVSTAGHGLTVTGVGTTKHGINATGGSTSSAGISAVGGGSGNGITATAGATGHGIGATGGGTSGDGINAVAATSGHGVTATGVGTTKHGINATGGATSSHGMLATGGGTGHGLYAVGGGTSGNGIRADGGGTGSGITGLGASTGHGLNFLSGSGATGNGITATSQATNGNGMSLTGNGTGNGLLSTGGAGASGDGIDAVAGGGVDIRGNQTGNLIGTVSTLTTYTGNTVQTGDSYARLGAPAGASVSADIAAVKSDTAAIKAKTDNLPEGIKINQALTNFEFFMVDSADHVTGKTGLTVAGAVSLAGAAFGALTNTPATEVANGIYKIDLAAADLNAVNLTLKFTAAGADARFIHIKTTP